MTTNEQGLLDDFQAYKEEVPKTGGAKKSLVVAALMGAGLAAGGYYAGSASTVPEVPVSLLEEENTEVLLEDQVQDDMMEEMDLFEELPEDEDDTLEEFPESDETDFTMLAASNAPFKYRADMSSCKIGKNVALTSNGATASQSSTPYARGWNNQKNTNGAASKAIDGNTNGNWRAASSMHTSNGASWWEVDLKSYKAIGRVKIWNRTDCCKNRLDKYTIQVLAADRSVVWEGGPFPGSSKTTYTHEVDGSFGRYVRVSMNGMFNLAEIQVFQAEQCTRFDLVGEAVDQVFLGLKKQKGFCKGHNRVPKPPALTYMSSTHSAWTKYEGEWNLYSRSMDKPITVERCQQICDELHDSWGCQFFSHNNQVAGGTRYSTCFVHKACPMTNSAGGNVAYQAYDLVGWTKSRNCN